MKIKRRDMRRKIPAAFQFTPSWPGLSRPSTSFVSVREEGVDARVKPGHDGERMAAYSAARFATFVNFFITRSRFSFER